VALGVLHDGLRPVIPDTTPKKYAELMQKCWAHDPDKRPVCDHSMHGSFLCSPHLVRSV
jgi:hypothetical protein